MASFRYHINLAQIKKLGLLCSTHFATIEHIVCPSPASGRTDPMVGDFFFFLFFNLFTYLHILFYYRLNKIGKNPKKVTQKSEHIKDGPESTINSVVTALAIEASKADAR